MKRFRDWNFRRESNPSSEGRRRFNWATLGWIYLPILASVLVAAALLVGIGSSGGGEGLGAWAQIATVAFTGILLMAGLIALLVLIAAAWGINEVIDVLPYFTGTLHGFLALASFRIRKASEIINRAVILVSGGMSAGDAVLSRRKVRSRKKTGRGEKDA